jgi:hypothetical protein
VTLLLYKKMSHFKLTWLWWNVLPPSGKSRNYQLGARAADRS